MPIKNVKLFLFLLISLLVLATCRNDRTTPAVTDTPPLGVTAVSAAATPIPTMPSTPTTAPTVAPTVAPTTTPTIVPTVAPTATAIPLPPTPAANEPPASVFAVYTEPVLDITPAIFHDPIAPDLNNVIVPFALLEKQQARLAQDGLVVNPGGEKEFFGVYLSTWRHNVPPFITSDSLLHTYHLLFDKLLRTTERQFFAPHLQQLNRLMLAQTDAQYQALQGTPWEDAALHAVAFIGVGSKLLDPTIPVPAYTQPLVDAEIAQIEAASSFQPSSLFPAQPGEDYTQYIPRGHYTLSPELSAYFKSMMWYGRMTFHLNTPTPDAGRAETRSALLLVQALRTAHPSLNLWVELYNPTAFLVGRSNNLTPLQYLDIIDTVYGTDPDLATIADENKLDLFIEAANQLPPLQILRVESSTDADAEKATKGFRFMGQRFIPDSYIFGQLTSPRVGTPEEPRSLPSGLDVMAAMGSDRAYTILDEQGETSYANYPEQMDKMRTWINGLTTDDWTATVYTTWLYTFHPLLAEPGAGYPQFMQSDAWLDKQLNASLGSWAELRHDTILYAESGGYGGGSDTGAPQPLLARGYVEPVPHFFARLEALIKMTLSGLDDYLDKQDRHNLQRLQRLAASLQAIATKELSGKPLAEGEFNLIRSYGSELEELAVAASDPPEGSSNPGDQLGEEPQAAVIADVHTFDSVVLEEAVGRINEIYVVVPLINDDGTIQLQVAKGGVFAYYEFPWPANDRLTTEKWRTMLDKGTAPPLPEWTNSFFAPETEFATLRQAIYQFQHAISYASWNLEAGTLYNISEAVQAQIAVTFDALREAKQYVGRQWINASYRSFDFQANDLVVVTMQETWEDALYNFQESPGDSDTNPSPAVGHRGPYTLDVTYTLKRQGEQWQIIQIVFHNEPPTWQSKE